MSCLSLLLSVGVIVPSPCQMKGPFPILSVPYHEDGSVDYGTMAAEAVRYAPA